MMCRLLGVSKAGFYWWKKAAQGKRIGCEAPLVSHTKAIFEQHKRRYGSPRVHQELARRAIGHVLFGGVRSHLAVS
jgi:hypothetical protein